jgi:Holliday junction resolvase
VSTASRGSARERQVRKQLEAEGWAVTRGAGSHGRADVWAAKLSSDVAGWKGHVVMPVLRLVQVKTDKDSPWENFRPADRAELLVLTAQTGGSAELCWWPAHGEQRWILPVDWPSN